MNTILLTGRDAPEVALPWPDLVALDSALEGNVMTPGDTGWDDAIRLWNGLVTKQPRCVVRVAGASDVAAAVGFARDHELLLGVRCGGHNIAGTAIPDGGLMIDMSGLRSVEVDPERKLAQVGGGCLLQDVDRATQEHGLATVLGFVSEVGAGGLTLGGGLGYLTRRFGWTVDNLRGGARSSPPTARCGPPAATEHPDLFWAVRGGGGELRRRHPVHVPPARGRPGWSRRPRSHGPSTGPTRSCAAYRKPHRRRRPASSRLVARC